MPPIKSNLAIFQEYLRLSSCLDPPKDHCCPNIECKNFTIGIQVPKAYYSFGKTKSGSQRYRCRLCNTTFAVGISTNRQKRPELNETVFKLLVNKVPFRRICEVAGLGSMNVLYAKIDFIHKQCIAYAAGLERQFPTLKYGSLYISIDRQDQPINWKMAEDKRNIVLNAVGSADNRSGYVFGIHVNFDPSLDQEKVEREAAEYGDFTERRPFRSFARVWLSCDYKDSISEWRGKHRSKRLGDTILDSYNESAQRNDIESSDAQTVETALPRKGMLIHSEYTLYAHFLFLKRLLRGVDKLRFYMDQESGIRAACFSAFVDEILEKRCDAFFVRINKDLTINQKRTLKAKSVRQLEDLRASSPIMAELSDYDLRLIVIKERMQEMVGYGKWNDRWLFYPFPDMSEPEKVICWLTDLNDHSYNEDHLARLYSKGTLHGIDRFFMQARRRLSLLERPIASASSEGRKWFGYSAYNPAMVCKLMDIFRVFYNFVEIGDDKKTPAMRIGLLSEPLSLNQILIYQ